MWVQLGLARTTTLTQGGSRWQGKGEGRGHVKEFACEPEVVEKSLGLHDEDQNLMFIVLLF